MSKIDPGFQKEKAQLLASLLRQAQKKGYIRASTITERFARYHPTDAEKEHYFSEFERNGIEVIYEQSSDAYLLDEAFLDTDGNPEEPFTSAEFTNMAAPDMDSLRIYLNEIHRFPTLSHKETLHLVAQIASGSASARDHLINCNLKFAYSIALKYVRTGFPLLDLIQQANIGLITAVNRYNPHYGTKFTTYAVFWIRYSILSYIKENLKMIRLPNSILADISKIKTVQEHYYAEHHCLPTDTELAQLTGLCISRVKFIQLSDFDSVSTDEKFGDQDSEYTLGDTLYIDDPDNDPHRDFYCEECRKSLQSFLANLSQKERDILRLRYGIGEDPHGEPKFRTLEEVGTILGISRERVRQIETRALNKLRSMPNISSLRYFLGI